MNSTGNCSTKLSREHILSKSILRQFEGLQASGLPWHTSDESVEYGIDALTSKVLCTTHNSSLSPLDAAAGFAFRQITDAVNYATMKSLKKRTLFYLVSGDALELWGIKTIMGLCSAKVARGKDSVSVDDDQIDCEAGVRALSDAGLKSPLGLYVHPPTGAIAKHGMGVSPLFSNQDGRIKGLRVNMHGVFFDCILERLGPHPEFFNDRTVYRPWFLDLNGPKRTSRIIFTWKSERTVIRRASIDLQWHPNSK